MATFNTLDVHIRGVVPLIVHNVQLANPLNRYAKALKEISGKRQKTEDDYAKMADIEWEGGLYLDKRGRPCVQADGLEATLWNAAKKKRKGPAAKVGLMVPEDAPIIYDGPKDIDKLKADERFRFVKAVRVGQARVIRTRPWFQSWEVKFQIIWFPDKLNLDEVIDFIDIGGRDIGLYEFRPRYGRYERLVPKP